MCQEFGGRGAKYFFSGPKCLPSCVLLNSGSRPSAYFLGAPPQRVHAANLHCVLLNSGSRPSTYFLGAPPQRVHAHLATRILRIVQKRAHGQKCGKQWPKMAQKMGFGVLFSHFWAIFSPLISGREPFSIFRPFASRFRLLARFLC